MTLIVAVILLGETGEPIALVTTCLVVASLTVGKKASIKRAADL
ncbi:hypothetical protein [Microcoleus sp. F4-D5]